MEDWKETLLSLKVPIKARSKKNVNVKTAKKKLSKQNKPDVKSKEALIKTRYKNSFLELSQFGYVRTYVSDKGFGFVRTDKEEYFFHASNKSIINHDIKSIDIEQKPIGFIHSIYARSGKTEAARWELIDYFNIPENLKVNNQNSYDEYRIKCLNELSLSDILIIITGNWFEEYKSKSKERNKFKNLGEIKDLEDKILEKVFLDKLKNLETGDWGNLPIFDVVSTSPYQFCKLWDIKEDKRHPEQLIKIFSTEYLSQIGTPKYTWFGLCTDVDTESKLFEWALRCDLEDEQKLWEQELEDVKQYAWFGKVATNLINSDWEPSPAECNWIHKLLESKKLTNIPIYERVRCFPWSDCI